MISNFKFQIFTALAALCLVACEKDIKVEPKEPEEPKDTTVVPVDTTTTPTDTVTPITLPLSFPKKHLIEEFTGQDCGYCPYGMNCVHDFMEKDTNWVLILHHYGYQADHFSVAGSKKITSALGVNGAPTMAINRAKTKTSETNTIVFHPGYLPGTSKSQFDTKTYASVNIANSYDAGSRELKVTVSGLVDTTDHTNLFLTVVLKESGMIDYQSDYYYSYEGWQEFRHCNAVRAFMTAPKGDTLHIANCTYSHEFTLAWDDKWDPNNCSVVAFITESFKPVVQAEQRPVVEGTAGGNDIEHGGVTPVPVEDYYPEPNATDGPAAYTGNKADTCNVAQAWYELSSDYTFWQIQAYGTQTVKVNKTNCVPFAFIYLFTEPGTNTIKEGTYEINTSGEPGTVMAGFRDDSQFLIDGSQFYLTSYSYLQQGYLVPEAQWMIAEGTMTIQSKSWKLSGRALNGSTIRLVGTTGISVEGKASAPRRAPKRKTDKGSFELCQ